MARSQGAEGNCTSEITLNTADLISSRRSQIDGSLLAVTREVLGANLDFHGADSSYGSHSWHPFPAKFPPQLPEFMIRHLSDTGDLVFDPMLGSGTTLIEALRARKTGRWMRYRPAGANDCHR